MCNCQLIRAILAIDAAWTSAEPSGVAVVGECPCGWRCLAVAPSYCSFLALVKNGTAVNWNQSSFPGQWPNPKDLVAAAMKLAGRLDLVTADIPLATVPITGRRAADSAISSTFGGRGCAAHSPSANRPGQIGVAISIGFANCGFPLATTTISGPGKLVEVYPHPALLTLLNAPYRVKYKVSHSGKYWPRTEVPFRVSKLLGEFGKITKALGTHISGITIPLPNNANTLAGLKRYEDAIDALVCAWVGICYLNNSATPYGDPTAAIWVP